MSLTPAMTLIDVDGQLAARRAGRRRRTGSGTSDPAAWRWRLDRHRSSNRRGQGAAPSCGGRGRRRCCRNRSSGPRSTASASSRSCGRGPMPRCSSWRPIGPHSKRAPCSAAPPVKSARSGSPHIRPLIAVLDANPRLARAAVAAGRRHRDLAQRRRRSPCRPDMPNAPKPCPLCGKPPVSRTCPLLQPRLQGSRPAELARRGLPDSRSGGAGPKGWTARIATARDAIASPAPTGAELWAQVAQLVEHATENRSVGGSIPPLGTIPLTDITRIGRSRRLIFRLVTKPDFRSCNKSFDKRSYSVR